MTGPDLRRTAFASTRPQGLRHEQLPLRLWRKAKRLGVWHPDDLDLTRDVEDWARLAAEEGEAV